MTPEQFCYWLQGFAELRVGTAGPTDAQWKAITERLPTACRPQAINGQTGGLLPVVTNPGKIQVMC